MYPMTAGVIVESKELWEELKQALEPLAIRLAFEAPQIPQDWMPFLERIDRTQPDVILLEVTRLREPLEDVVKRLRSTSGNPAVFALNGSAQPDLILAALRAGVSEFLYPPIAEPLKAALERLAETREKAREKDLRGGRTIGFLSAKGGCGATTIACHMARELAGMDKGKVLLADVDLQSGMIGFLMKTTSDYSLADAVNNLQRLDLSYWRGLVSNGTPNLEIITAPTLPAAKQLPAGHIKQVLAFARSQYDWIVLDLGRSVTAATLSILDGIDETYLVTTPDVPALHQAKQIVQLLLDAGYSRSHLRLILNRTTKRIDVTLDELESMLGVPVYATVADDSDALYEACSEGRMVDRSSAPGEDYARIAAKIAGIPEPAHKRRFSLFG
jgi:pilus assembly protein CpaE